MELLIIKCGSDYIRIRENRVLAVGLDKASVFPLDRIDQVRERLKQVRAGGFPRAAIYRLHLSESPFEEPCPCN